MCVCCQSVKMAACFSSSSGASTAVTIVCYWPLVTENAGHVNRWLHINLLRVSELLWMQPRAHDLQIQT